MKLARTAQIIALMATMGYSSLTSWQWASSHLHAVTWERAVVFVAFEAVMIAFALAARSRQHDGEHRGWQHGATYLFAAVMCLMAWQVSGDPITTAVRFAGGPVASLALWHSLLGLELRSHGTRREGLIGAALREVRERITSYLGIGHRGEDSASIARNRAADRAVKYACRVEPRTARGRVRRASIVARAVDAALHGLDDAERVDAERAIVGRVDRRKSVTALWSETRPYEWRASMREDAQTAPEIDAQWVPEAEPVAYAPAPITVPSQVSDSQRSTQRVESRLTVISSEAAPRGAVTRIINDAVRAGVTDTASIKARLDAEGVSAHPGTIRKARAAAMTRLDDDAHRAGGYM